VQAALRFMAAKPIDVAQVREILSDVVMDDYRASKVIPRIGAVVRKGDPRQEGMAAKSERFLRTPFASWVPYPRHCDERIICHALGYGSHRQDP
jgi:hypothetical protein